MSSFLPTFCHLDPKSLTYFYLLTCFVSHFSNVEFFFGQNSIRFIKNKLSHSFLILNRKKYILYFYFSTISSPDTSSEESLDTTNHHSVHTGYNRSEYWIKKVRILDIIGQNTGYNRSEYWI